MSEQRDVSEAEVEPLSVTASSIKRIRRAVRGDWMRDHVTSRYVQARYQIGTATLRRWRQQGRVRAVKYRGVWYYVRQDILDIMRSDLEQSAQKTLDATSAPM